ncbi:SPOR domain-containing protein [Brevibacillus sp. SYP-B805]|uniref:SPOR domain-containing protein n=1 Tax=Brevibacillus sp. SYP-B805 TaxID=1578199 RepID=UPI0013EC6BE6|nr:SPOR domain-containing protein [Brevibacillus sp. SYP-B805]NGQ94314.1 SPOR domain-containing protein [Brevibacillus sp. SYP-B805]
MERNGAGRISIKLNGQQTELRQRPPEKAAPAAEPKPPAMEPEESAYERLHKLRITMGKMADQPADATFGQPEYSFAGTRVHEEEDGGEPLPPRRARKMPSWLSRPPIKLMISTVGAVALGLVFGFLVLAVFTQEQLGESYRNVLGDTLKTMAADQAAQESATDGGDGHTAATGTTAEQAGQPVNLALAEQTFSMAQVGAFANPEAAQEAIGQLAKKGFPHFLYKGSDRAYLFAATASARDDLLGMASLFKNQGLDVYVKDVTLPGFQKEVKMVGTADPARIQAFFADGMELARRLTSWSGRYLGNAQGVALTAVEEGAIKELHRRVLDGSRILQTTAPESWQPHVTGMLNGLNQAVTAMEQAKSVMAEGKTANAEANAWQIQAGALSYLEHYAMLVGEETK